MEKEEGEENKKKNGGMTRQEKEQERNNINSKKEHNRNETPLHPRGNWMQSRTLLKTTLLPSLSRCSPVTSPSPNVQLCRHFVQDNI